MNNDEDATAMKNAPNNLIKSNLQRTDIGIACIYDRD